MRHDIRALLTAMATVAVIVVNALANVLPINGLQTGEISDRFQVYFTPAGYVFSIWGVIYLALIAFSCFQALPANRDNSTLKAIAPLYWIASAANICWILCWHYELFGLSVAVMLALLASLIAIYLRLDIGRAETPAAFRWAVHVPFSLYLGWITVATIANVTAVLWHVGWGGFGIAPESWTAIVLAVAVIVAAAVSVTRADAVYDLVLVWAFVGIYAKHPDVPLVATSALAAAALVALLAVVALLPTGPLPLRPKAPQL